MAKEKLIEYLVRETGCNCLSDLRLQQRVWAKQLISVLEKTDVNQYTIEEWGEAASYLVDVKLQIPKNEKPGSYACKSLIDCLKLKND